MSNPVLADVLCILYFSTRESFAIFKQVSIFSNCFTNFKETNATAKRYAHAGSALSVMGRAYRHLFQVMKNKNYYF